MLIRKIEPVTTIDFPGVIAALVYTVGCNMRCPYCYNHSLFEENADDYETTSKALDEIKNNKLINGVAITGGEPTIHSDLPKFIKNIKDLGLKVKLDTNGTNPVMLNMCLPYVDYVAMDVKTDPKHYHMLRYFYPENIQLSIMYLKNSGIPYEFRITCVEPFVNHRNIHMIGRMVDGADKVYLQKARLENVFEPDIKMTASDTEKLKYYQYVLLRYAKSVELRL